MPKPPRDFLDSASQGTWGCRTNRIPVYTALVTNGLLPEYRGRRVHADDSSGRISVHNSRSSVDLTISSSPASCQSASACRTLPLSIAVKLLASVERFHLLPGRHGTSISLHQPSTPRPLSNRNHVRRSASSIHCSIRLAVATSRDRSQRAWVSRKKEDNWMLSSRNSASIA
jgi:hypothetical protein